MIYDVITNFVFSRSPVDYKDPCGFIAFSLVEFYIIYYALKFSAIFTCYPIGVSYFMSAFAEDIKQELISLDELNAKEESEKNLYKKLCNIIELHSTVKQ